MNCHKCGERLYEGEERCPACGARVKKGSSSGVKNAGRSANGKKIAIINISALIVLALIIGTVIILTRKPDKAEPVEAGSELSVETVSSYSGREYEAVAEDYLAACFGGDTEGAISRTVFNLNADEFIKGIPGFSGINLDDFFGTLPEWQSSFGNILQSGKTASAETESSRKLSSRELETLTEHYKSVYGNFGVSFSPEEADSGYEVRAAVKITENGREQTQQAVVHIIRYKGEWKALEFEYIPLFSFLVK